MEPFRFESLGGTSVCCAGGIYLWWHDQSEAMLVPVGNVISSLALLSYGWMQYFQSYDTKYNKSIFELVAMLLNHSQRGLVSKILNTKGD